MKRRKVLSKLLGLLLILAMICAIVPISADATELYVERKADVVFVIDATGSMGGCISSVKSNITDFVNLISKEDVDVRVKYVIYRDITCSEPTQASGWYSATDASASYLTDVKATGGGDGPETLLDGIGMMLSDSFRTDAVKYCIFFTDAETKTDNNYGYGTEDDAVNAVNAAGIVMSMVTSSELFDTHSKYVSTSEGGVIADIYGDYSILLKGLADSIIGKLDELSGLSMSPRSCKEGEDVTVRVTSISEITYGGDFKVLFDGASVEVVLKESNYFEFKVPTDKILGKYEVSVVNGGVTSKVGNFTIESAAEYGAMAPSSTIKGTAVTVRVPVSKLNYQKDFKVALGGNKVSISSKQTDYFEFKVSSSLEVKSYDVIVTNGGQNTYIGEFVVNSKTPSFGAMDKTSCQEESTVTVKVPVSNIDYGSDFAVSMNGVNVTVRKFSSYFKFTVPNSMAVGLYAVEVTNEGVQYAIGTFEVKAKEVPKIEFGAMDVTETEEGTTAKVKVSVSGLETYGSDFAVDMDGTVVSVKKYAGSISFTVPSDLPAKIYTVSVVNEGITYTLGTFEVKAKEVPKIEFGAMDVTETEEGTTAKVKVSVSGLETYGSDFAVDMDGTVVSVKKYAGSISFTVPSDLPAKIYTVSVVNEGITYTLGTFEVKAKEVPKIEFGAMDVTESNAGTSTKVKVTVSGLVTYADDFSVNLNGNSVAVKKYAGLIKFTVSASMPAGSYTVTVTNDGNTYTIGTYIIK